MNQSVLLKSLVSLPLAFLLFAAHAEITIETLKPFKSLCIAEQATGFNWKEGGWILQRYIEKKYILQKLDYEREIAAAKFVDRPQLCTKPKVTVYEKHAWVSACYIFNEWGEAPSLMINAQDCDESYVDDKLVAIKCQNIGRFKPNGLFVKFPSSESLDLSNSITKDSMVLSVGKCGVL